MIRENLELNLGMKILEMGIDCKKFFGTCN